MENCKAVKDENDNHIDQKTYRSMIGSLCLCLISSKSERVSYEAVKKIIKYIKRTNDYELGTHFDLCAYTDFDYAGTRNNRKSTSGACYFLSNCLVSWHCKK